MAVVINEFQVAPAPPQDRRGESGSEQSRPAQPASVKPEEIERVIRKQKERLARVRTY